MIGHSRFFSDFTRDNIQKMTAFMQVYQAEPGEMIIREGDVDDYMLFIIEGRVNIVKTDSHGERRPMTIVGPGSILGEMSMIDGEPRFASCIALENNTPLIQLIDTPLEPLPPVRRSPVKMGLFGCILGFLLASFWIFIRFMTQAEL